eukprot:g67913.t1
MILIHPNKQANKRQQGSHEDSLQKRCLRAGSAKMIMRWKRNGYACPRAVQVTAKPASAAPAAGRRPQSQREGRGLLEVNIDRLQGSVEVRWLLFAKCHRIPPVLALPHLRAILGHKHQPDALHLSRFFAHADSFLQGPFDEP